MLTVVVEWLAVATALPVLAFLGLVLASAVLHSYGPGLGLRLRGIVRTNLEGILEHPASLRQYELEAILKCVARIADNERAAAAGPFADAEASDRFFERISNVLYGGGQMAEQALVRLRCEREDQWRLAERRVRARVQRSTSPVALARWERVWVASEIGLVLLTVLQREGLRVARIMVARAGADVTSGSVLGLIGGVSFWVFSPVGDKIFLLYIGNGVTLGAFGGLAFTAKHFAGIILDAAQLPSKRSRYQLLALVLVAPTLLHLGRVVAEHLNGRWP